MNGNKQQNGITQHLSETTLSEYSSGTLNEALEVLVACHLTLCPTCRKLAQEADSLGGYFMDEAEPLQPRLSAMDVLQNGKTSVETGSKGSGISDVSTIRHLSGNSEAGEINGTSSACYNSAARHGIPKPLARKLPAEFDDLKWKPLAKGIQQIDLKQGGSKKNGAFKLLKLQPGVELIQHTHGDHEITLVLQGSYSDEYGRFGVGDVADLGADHAHKPVIDSDVPCIALIASNSPARYHGLLGRIIQPFVDI